MQIKTIVIGKLTIPLIRPFITAVRRTENVEDIVIQIKTTCGKTGYGSAAATPLITGDSLESIISAIKYSIAPKLIGKNLADFNQLIQINQQALQKNTSAKAAVDIALHDLFAQKCNLPLYQFLGGNKNQIKSCITISVKCADEMAADALEFVSQGFTTLKIKVGLDNILTDLNRIRAVYRATADNNIKLVIDANQGWDAKSAIKILNQIEEEKLNIAFVEQPVTAHDLTNLKFIHDSVTTPIFADESCFLAVDALNLAKLNACSGINIKLMKCAGLNNALAIYNITKAANMQAMVGCMLESPIGVAATASFALSKPDIYFTDLDPMALIQYNPIAGGATILGDTIILSDNPGLGIQNLGNGFKPICEIENAV